MGAWYVLITKKYTGVDPKHNFTYLKLRGCRAQGVMGGAGGEGGRWGDWMGGHGFNGGADR